MYTLYMEGGENNSSSSNTGEYPNAEKRFGSPKAKQAISDLQSGKQSSTDPVTRRLLKS